MLIVNKQQAASSNLLLQTNILVELPLMEANNNNNWQAWLAEVSLTSRLATLPRAGICIILAAKTALDKVRRLRSVEMESRQLWQGGRGSRRGASLSNATRWTCFLFYIGHRYNHIWKHIMVWICADNAAQEQWELFEVGRRRVRSDSAPSYTLDTRLSPPAKFTGHLFETLSSVCLNFSIAPIKVPNTNKLIYARLGVSRPIYVNVDTPNLGFT